LPSYSKKIFNTFLDMHPNRAFVLQSYPLFSSQNGNNYGQFDSVDFNGRTTRIEKIDHLAPKTDIQSISAYDRKRPNWLAFQVPFLHATRGQCSFNTGHHQLNQAPERCRRNQEANQVGIQQTNPEYLD
jgi:hypothetical protein